MKLFFFILSFLICISCRQGQTQGSGQVDSSASSVTIEDRVKSLEVRAYKSEADSVWQAKQIRSAYVKDSLKTIINNFLIAQNTDLRNRHIRDSIYQWNAINKTVTIVRFAKDSITKLLALNKLNDQINLKIASVLSATVVNLKAEYLSQKRRHELDSIYSWIAIKQLQGVSPNTQIPIMQKQIKNLQTMDKTMQSNIDNMGVQIQDSVFGIRNFIGSISLFLDTTQFSLSNKILKITDLPSILQSLVDVKKDIRTLQLINQIPATIK